MKEIDLPITQTYSLTIDTHNIDMSKAVDAGSGRFMVPLGIVVDPQMAASVVMARQNGGKVLYATISIEQKLEGVLLDFFMGPFVQHDDRRALFEQEVLQSSALSFNAKRTLVTKIVNDQDLLIGKKKGSLQGQLKKIMEWRNAFAHGKVQHDSRTGCFIKYYSGDPKTLALNDAYWDDVEQTFKSCDGLLQEAKQALRRPVLPQAREADPEGGAA